MNKNISKIALETYEQDHSLSFTILKIPKASAPLSLLPVLKVPVNEIYSLTYCSGGILAPVRNIQSEKLLVLIFVGKVYMWILRH